MTPLYFCHCGAEIPDGKAPSVTLDGRPVYQCRRCELAQVYGRSKNLGVEFKRSQP